MAIIFTDEDMMYIDREQDEKLRSIRQAIDTSKAKGDRAFCRKCGHIMQYFTVGNARLLQCVFCGNRVAELIQTDLASPPLSQ